MRCGRSEVGGGKEEGGRRGLNADLAFSSFSETRASLALNASDA